MYKRKLLAPMTGTASALAVGLGFTVESCLPVVYAPASGRVCGVGCAPLSVEIGTSDGLSIAVLPVGRCCVAVAAGDVVRAGEVIACMTGKGKVSVQVCAPSALRGVVLSPGAVIGGRTAVMRYRCP